MYDLGVVFDVVFEVVVEFVFVFLLEFLVFGMNVKVVLEVRMFDFCCVGEMFFDIVYLGFEYFLVSNGLILW